MTIGPLEYIVVGFPGNKFNGAIAPALAKLIDSNTIRILDLLFIAKDANGDVVAVEFDELDELAAFADLDGETGGLISPEDVEHTATRLEPNSAAALLIWEDVWATEFATAIRDSGGYCSKAGASRTSSSSSPSRTCPTQPDRTEQGDRRHASSPTHRTYRRPHRRRRRNRIRRRGWRPAPPGPEVRRPGAGRGAAAAARGGLRRSAGTCPAAGIAPDAIEQLKELAQLKDQGILTEEEFAAQKAKILG